MKARRIGLALDPADARELASPRKFESVIMRSLVFAIVVLMAAALVRAQDAASTPFQARSPVTVAESPTPTPPPKPKATPTSTAKPSARPSIKPLETAA